jgi:hypothetical protein
MVVAALHAFWRSLAHCRSADYWRGAFRLFARCDPVKAVTLAEVVVSPQLCWDDFSPQYAPLDCAARHGQILVMVQVLPQLFLGQIRSVEVA